jgi:hypothetical protein
MSTTQESLFVLDLLEAGKIDVFEAETLIYAMQPQSGRRRVIGDLRVPNAISVTVDGKQADLGKVMDKLRAAFEATVSNEVN